MCYCLCASLAQHPAQEEGLILCGLERINFVLTLAGCGLHLYPPLLSLPGARQKRKQASGDGENEGERESIGLWGRAGTLRSVISEKAFIFFFSLRISQFHELASLQYLFKYVYCVSLWVCARVWVCAFIRGKLFFSLMRVDRVQGQPLHIRSEFSVSLGLISPFALSAVCGIWKSVFQCNCANSQFSACLSLPLSLRHTQTHRHKAQVWRKTEIHLESCKPLGHSI